MNIDFNIDLNKVFAALTRPSPARDWLVTLALFAVVGLAGIAYGSYLFIGMELGDVTGVDQSTSGSGPTITSAQIEKVLAVYRARRANFESGDYAAPVATSTPAK